MTGLISPKEFFGFEMGSDRKIARWDRIVDYYTQLDQQSDKIRVIDIGPSTEGHPFLLVIISSAENLADVERLREVNLRLSDPRGLSEQEVEALIGEGKAVVCQAMSLHATEIGGTQMAPELAWDLLTRDDEETHRILDNVIFLMVPCFNPDGQIMVTDWYNRWLGTEYEGCGLPWLYHKYAGHDNNRDAFQTNLVESQYMAAILFRDWIPQVFVDHHHTGSYGTRFFVPPYPNPIRPNADPLVWLETGWYGAHMACKLEGESKTGVSTATEFPGWIHLGFHGLPTFHNIADMFTESASAKLATPIFIHFEQLIGDEWGTMPTHEAQTNFPHPWPGGWWRLRDIVEYQKISAWAALDMAGRNREMVLRNAYLKAKRQTERGEQGNPAAYIIPPGQHDPLTATKMMEKLLAQGIEVHVTREELMVGGIRYPVGSYVISTAQPKSGVVRTLLGRTFYVDNGWTRKRDGSPRRIYDTTTDTMAEFMGVRVDASANRVQGALAKVTEIESPRGRVEGESRYGYALDCRLNDAYAAVNRLLSEEIPVWRASNVVEIDGGQLPPGTFVMGQTDSKTLAQLADEMHLVFHGLRNEVAEKRRTPQNRIGVYQRYYGGNTDEGWTRLVLEQFGFAYTRLNDKDVKAGGLRERFDVIILPHDAGPMITGEKLEEWWKERRPHQPVPVFPPEYRSGVGEEGVEALKSFVAEGGTLVAFGEACNLVIEKLDLRLRNVVQGVPSSEFFCPGSTLRARVDNSHPLGYGMPEESLVLFWDSPAFTIQPSNSNESYEVVVDYPERDLLQSGWLIGEQTIQRKAAMVAARKGEGKAVLIGFRPQHRAQTHGTFKLLFNSLLS